MANNEFQPYVGPRPYERTVDDQHRFFGRDYEASELISRITAHSAVLLYSQSGAGKTSLVNAKLIPMLEATRFEVLKPARVRDVLPDDLALDQVSNIYVFNVLRTWDEGRTPPARLAQTSISDFLSNSRNIVSDDEDETPRVAIFDQFEEMFISYQERFDDREVFFEQVGDALEGDRLLRVVFAMREDYIAELDPYLHLLPEKLRTRFRLERLSEDDALLAITEPLKGTEYSYASGVAQELVEDLLMVPVETAKGIATVRGESVEPVQLQVACQTLWQNCQTSWRGLGPSETKIITREQLETYGDVDRALSSFYESVIGRVVQAARVKEGVLRKWFEQYLITSASTHGTVFRGQTETGNVPNAAVDELVNQHIIRGELRGGSRWYELTHDRLIGPIKSSNERWFLTHSGGEQTPKRLENRAHQWVLDGRRKEDLLDEAELLEATRWLDSPNAAELGYTNALYALVQASRNAHEEARREREHALAMEQELRAEAERQRAEEKQNRLEEQAKAYRRLKLALTSLAVMFAIAVAASVFAFMKLRTARAAQKEALEQRERAVRNEVLATSQRVAAQAAEHEATVQRAEAVAQRAIAQKEAAEAKAAQSRAEAAQRDADIQRRLANSRTQIADAERIKAQNNEKQATILLEIERGNRQIAETTYKLNLNNTSEVKRRYLETIEETSQQVLRHYDDLASLNTSRKSDAQNGKRQTLTNVADVLSRQGSDQKALQLYQQALATGSELGNADKARIEQKIGDIYYKLNNWSKAVEAYEQSPATEPAFLMKLGQLYDQVAKPDKAVETYQRALQIYEESQFTVGQQDALVSMGNVNYASGKKDQAEKNYEKALALYKRSGSEAGQARMLVSLGQIYADRNELDKSVSFLEQAVPLFKNLDDRPGEANALKSLGAVYERKPYFTLNAIANYLEAVELFHDLRDRKRQGEVLLAISRLYERIGEKDLASQYSAKAQIIPPP